MIKQQFFYNDKEVLRLYHRNFEDYPKEYKLEEAEEISGGKVKLLESWIDDHADDSISYDHVISGFLPAGDDKNPYARLSCEYQEFITMQKDFLDGGRILQPTLFREISDFIVKWSGFDLKKAPFSCYNVLIFSPTGIQVKLKLSKEKDNSVHLEITSNCYENLVCIAKFKQYGKNVYSTVRPFSDDVLLAVDRAWDSMDIEIFADEGLVYANYDVVFLRSVHINLGVVTKQVKMSLGQGEKTITLKRIDSQPFVVGEEARSKEMPAYHYQELLLKRSLTVGKRFDFLTKGEYGRALEIFEYIAGTRGYREMWIFDPYFIKYNTMGGKDRLNDIVKVLANNLDLKKTIVFEGKEEDVHIDFEDFQKAIQNTVRHLQQRGVKLNFEFVCTDEHFHDRFIFLEGETNLQSFQLGTSFNSFGDNYSTIVELDPFEGKNIFQTFKNQLIIQEHIILQESL